MIVPRSRLLRWVALVVLPFALLAAVLPETLPLGLGLIGLFLLVVLLDAARAPRALDGLTVELPSLIRLSKDRPAHLEVRLRNDQPARRLVRLGLALPREIYSAQDDLLAVLPENQPSRLAWPCLPLRRGQFQLERAYLEGYSPLGFWAIRSMAPIRSELRVYPNLLSERKRVAALFLHRGGSGIHTQRQVGKGRQFDGLRDYVPGDSSEDIHWKATAKRGQPVTKIFQIERTQEVYVIIDAARLSARAGSPPLPSRPSGSAAETRVDGPVLEVTVLERFITSALILGLAAEQQGDLFGLVTFSDKVQTFVRAGNGRAHFNYCREALYTLQPRIVTPDFDELASFLRLRLRRRALLVFLTALDDPSISESFVRSVDLLTRQHLLLVNVMQPAGARPLFSEPSVTSVDELYQQLGGHLLWDDLRQLGTVLRLRGVHLSLLASESMSAELVSQYLSVKQRQLL